MTEGRLAPALTCGFTRADDGIRTRDPHLGKGARSVLRRSPPFIPAGQSTANALAASRGWGRTVANRGDWGETWGERRCAVERAASTSPCITCTS